MTFILLLTDRQREIFAWCETAQALMWLERLGGVAPRAEFGELVGSEFVSARGGNVQITERGRRFLDEGRGLSKHIGKKRRPYDAGG